jgi:hypothetical protein
MAMVRMISACVFRRNVLAQGSLVLAGIENSRILIAGLCCHCMMVSRVAESNRAQIFSRDPA